jgi:hypothetical protein
MVKTLEYAKQKYQQAISRPETAQKYCRDVGVFLGIGDAACNSTPAKNYAFIMSSMAPELAMRLAEGLRSALSI